MSWPQRPTDPIAGRLLLVAVAGLVVVGAHIHAADTALPNSVDLEQCRFTIVGERYVTQIQDSQRRWGIENPAISRIIILNLKIDKPRGQSLKLVSSDLVLHYLHGTKLDYAACRATTTFSTERDAVRSWSIQPGAFGWTGSVTLGDNKEAATVYVDLAFGTLEPDTTEYYLCIAQPACSGRSNGY